jgi:hypothetical protein
MPRPRRKIDLLNLTLDPDFQAYATSTRNVKASHITSFANWCAGSEVPFPEVTVGDVRRFAIFLLQNEADANVTRGYVRTCLDFLILKGFLGADLWGGESLQILYRQIKTLAKREPPQKALPFDTTDLQVLSDRHKSIATFWIKSGLRISSLASVRDDLVTRSATKITGVLQRLKIAPGVSGGGAPTFTMYCDCPNAMCPVHSRLPSWGWDEKELKEIMKQIGRTTHAPRRTLAITLRRLIEDFNFRISIRRINEHFHWSPSSKMFFEYSNDYADFRQLHLIMPRGLISHVLLGKNESECFVPKRGFLISRK